MPTREEIAAIVMQYVEGYDRVIVAPVLEDWVGGNPFRAEDRHRLLILSDYLASMNRDNDRPELEPLIQAVKGAIL